LFRVSLLLKAAIVMFVECWVISVHVVIQLSISQSSLQYSISAQYFSPTDQHSLIQFSC
jgi:hypothetical protein